MKPLTVGEFRKGATELGRTVCLISLGAETIEELERLGAVNEHLAEVERFG